MKKQLVVTAALGPAHVQLTISGGNSGHRETVVKNFKMHSDIQKVVELKKERSSSQFVINVYPKKQKYPSIPELALSILSKEKTEEQVVAPIA